MAVQSPNGPEKFPAARTFADTLQTFAATPIGTFTLSAEMFTRPVCLVLPPLPPPVAVGLLMAVQSPNGPLKLLAASTFADTLQTLAATPTGTLISVSETLTRPFCWVAAVAELPPTASAMAQVAPIAAIRNRVIRFPPWDFLGYSRRMPDGVEGNSLLRI